MDKDNNSISVKTEINKTTEEINQLILKYKINECKSVKYEDEYKGYEGKKLEPKMSQENIQRKGYSFKMYGTEEK